MLKALQKIFGGDSNDRELKKLWPLVDEINDHAERLQHVTDDELKARTESFRQALRDAAAPIEAEQAEKYKNRAKVGFGSQIRNYFLHPDQRVKDARTGHYVGNFNSVLDGSELQGFFDAFLRLKAGKTEAVNAGDDD